jgi:hypothetical protein
MTEPPPTFHMTPPQGRLTREEAIVRRDEAIALLLDRGTSDDIAAVLNDLSTTLEDVRTELDDVKTKDDDDDRRWSRPSRVERSGSGRLLRGDAQEDREIES